MWKLVQFRSKSGLQVWKKTLSEVFFQSIALTLKNSFLLSNGQLHRQSQRWKALWKRLKQLFNIPYCYTERSFYHLLIFILVFLKMNSKLNEFSVSVFASLVLFQFVFGSPFLPSFSPNFEEITDLFFF